METQLTTGMKEIVHSFATAVQNKDFDLIASLLADDGEFQIQDALLDTVEHCSKSVFMDWLKPVLYPVIIDKIQYDNCILCKVGNPVVIFNEGQFPKVKKDSSTKSMNGLMLEIRDNLIYEVNFCYSFAHLENMYQFECNGKAVKEYMKDNPEISLMDAIHIVLTIRGYKV